MPGAERVSGLNRLGILPETKKVLIVNLSLNL
jgi:hypothetical protein